jgi:hypothetical protein
MINREVILEVAVVVSRDNQIARCTPDDTDKSTAEYMPMNLEMLGR